MSYNKSFKTAKQACEAVFLLPFRVVFATLRGEKGKIAVPGGTIQGFFLYRLKRILYNHLVKSCN